MLKTGVVIKKLFAGFGYFQGKLASVDKEQSTGRVLYHIKFEDGDTEDLYYTEMVDLVIEDW